MTNATSVLILGGGINGAAIARELALQKNGFVLVDTADIAGGATAYSSRLIHGGLRYLEHAEYDLVRESLRERAILLQNAPQLVRPLRFFIPVENRFTGMLGAATRFLHLPWKSPFRSRGKYVVQLGLSLYDRFAAAGKFTLPKHAVHEREQGGEWGVGSGVSKQEGLPPQVERQGTRWLLSYSDAQVQFPERFTLAMLKDAVAIARQAGTRGEVLPYHAAQLSGKEVSIQPVNENSSQQPIVFQPVAIINATGAWVDDTLQRLQIASARLIGGTKGSHFFTWQTKLCEQLRGQAVYAEAADGRPVFVLPFGSGALVGTTDLPFEGDPATAVATEDELTYLLAVVNELFPAAAVQRSDITLHGCGVRPLPFVGKSTPAGITRRHWLHWHDETNVPLVSIIGGKLTTCRSLAEETAAALAKRLSLSFTADATRTRSFPPEPALPTAAKLSEITPAAVRPFLAEEFATKLDDLVERRLMWLYESHLSREAIEHLADVLVSLDQLHPAGKADAVARVCERLQKHFGRKL
jgi:glycerol-3-phosphate dehydrogenase